MQRRFALLIALAMLILPTLATSAFAASPGYDPPSPGAELVRRDVVGGAEAVRAGLSSVDSVKLGQQATVIHVNDDKGPHAITVDYSELSRDKKTAGLGILAASYIGLGALVRFMRLLRASGLAG